MNTRRIKRDPMYYTVDGHFDDRLVYDIPGLLRAEQDDSTISEEFGTEEHESLKRRQRRKNQKELIHETRKQREEIEQIRKDLKPFLISAAIIMWLWSHILSVAIAAIAVGAIVTWWATAEEAPVKTEKEPVESSK